MQKKYSYTCSCGIDSIISEVEGNLRDNKDSQLFTEVISWALQVIGVDKFAYVYFCQAPQEASDIFIAGTYSKQWVEYYKERNVFKKDPVIQRTSFSSKPFLWGGNAEDYATKEEVFSQSSKYGIEKGYSIPIHDPGYAFGSINLATSNEDVDFERIVKEHYILLQVIGNLAHRYRPIPSSREKVVNLSDREREFLCWLAQGKTYEEISIIMNISKRTVKFHARRVADKMDCINVKQTIMKALKMNLL